MGKGELIAIQGSKGSGKTTLIFAVMLAWGLFLLGLTLLEQRLLLENLALSLCDLRRKLGQIPLGVPDLKYTGTVTLTPEPRRMDASLQPPQADERTENT